MTGGLEMRYFVLKPRGTSAYSEASRLAMIAYADAISGENPQLAGELLAWVDKERNEAQKAMLQCELRRAEG